MKAAQFTELENKLVKNKETIKLFKNVVFVLVLFFVVLSFITLYTKTVANISGGVQITLGALLTLIFVTLVFIDKKIKEKKKENRRLDMMIYNLLKL